MTLLAVDIGNTNVTLGLFRDAELAGSWRATTRAEATPDEVAAQVRELLALDDHGTSALTAVAIASVVPPLTETITQFVRRRLQVDPLVVDAAALDGILAISIDRP
ncbi:MAG TPA: type III pantothenate kinase, partial [Candidatus Limnocylindrales bacterium]|nr:type III pantothenate kinase [Candidatus Limnocylindrales bacterium]